MATINKSFWYGETWMVRRDSDGKIAIAVDSDVTDLRIGCIQNVYNFDPSNGYAQNRGHEHDHERSRCYGAWDCLRDLRDEFQEVR